MAGDLHLGNEKDLDDSEVLPLHLSEISPESYISK
jgi:hypothetical protein